MYVEGRGETIGRNLLHTEIEQKNKRLSIINFHGLWNGEGKGDSSDRLKQSDNIVRFVKDCSSPVVLCGDFNLSPDTESIKRIENAGLRNLIKEYGVTSTRTSHYTKPEKHANYVFVSSDIEVKDFRVLPEEVSDHRALMVEVV